MTEFLTIFASYTTYFIVIIFLLSTSYIKLNKIKKNRGHKRTDESKI